MIGNKQEAILLIHGGPGAIGDLGDLKLQLSKYQHC